MHGLRSLSASLISLALFACGDSGSDVPTGTGYALGSVVIDADGNRTTYVQVVDTLDGPFTNATAIEMPGNGVILSRGQDIFVGLAEEPTWIKYTVDDTGKIAETGRLSLLGKGATYIDFGNAIVDDTTAVTVLSAVAKAIVWNPQTMAITGEIDLSHLVRAGLELEVWTTTARDGLVYVPGRWANWTSGTIFAGVSMTILDPKALTVVAHAQDDRCASGGRAVFAPDGTLYVLGDGRTYSIQMFANAAGTAAPTNCLLRIKPGATDFDPDYDFKIPALTGGPEAIGELETARDGSGIGFAKMFHPDKLPPGLEPVDFEFWSVPAHKLWRLELGDTPRAQEVTGLPFGEIGFGSSALDGKLYSGETFDSAVSDVYKVDPATNSAVLRFRMDGYFNGLYRLTR